MLKQVYPTQLGGENRKFHLVGPVVWVKFAVNGAAQHPRRPENNWTACSVWVLGSAASSELQIAPGGVRGRQGGARPRLPLLPHAPSTTAGDLLCACSERSTRASRQEAVWWGATLRKGMPHLRYLGSPFYQGRAADWGSWYLQASSRKRGS